MKKPFLLKLFATVMLICLSMAMLTACEDVNVEVTFIVDDEVYAVVNLQDGDTVEMPEDPTKDGFVFDGWYLDKDIWKKPFIGKVEDTTLVKLDVYAKWVEGETQCNHMWSQWTVGVEPTCSEEGKQGRYCLKCSKTEVESIEKLAHTEEVIPAVEPTCQSEGSTEGKKCSICNEVLIAPQSIDKLEHNYGDWIVDEEANCTNAGSQHKVCQNKGCEDRVDEEIPTNGKHVEVVIPAVEPTCQSEGVTEGKKCSICNEVLIAPQSIAKTEHNYVNGICVNEGCGAKDLNYVEPVKYSEGLQFTLNEDNESYSVSGIGTCTDTNIVIPAVYNEKPVTSVGDSAFYYCSGLTSITIPDSVTSIGMRAFFDCGGLTSVTIPNSVTSIGIHAFYYCSALTSITISDGVTSIGSFVFENCPALTSITIPNSVTSIGYGAFVVCKSLTSVTIPNSVTSIGYGAFVVCKSLTSVTIPNSVTSIGSDAFRGCSSLTSITIPDSVTSIGHQAFLGCDIQYNEYDNALYLGNEDNPYLVLIEAKDKLITSCEINDKTKIIANVAFGDCWSLTSITIPNSVTSIDGGAFYGCSALTSITISDSVTSIGSDAFRGCSSLTSITIPDSVTSIGHQAFLGCDIQYNEYDNALYLGNEDNPYLVLIEAKDKLITSCEINDKTKIIANVAFGDCWSLTSITIPNSVTSIDGGAFYGCSALTSITISDSVTSIGAGAFDYCDNLQYNKYDNCLYLGNEYNPYLALIDLKSTSITSFTVNDKTKVIYGKAFNYCWSLTCITIPDSVTYIGDYAFSYCSSLTSIVIPDSVTSIGSHAFYGCSALTSVTIPSSVTYIDSLAFCDCSEMAEIKFDGTVEQWNAIRKSSNWNYNVPAEKVICSDGEVAL